MFCSLAGKAGKAGVVRGRVIGLEQGREGMDDLREEGEMREGEMREQGGNKGGARNRGRREK